MDIIWLLKLFCRHAFPHLRLLQLQMSVHLYLGFCLHILCYTLFMGTKTEEVTNWFGHATMWPIAIVDDAKNLKTSYLLEEVDHTNFKCSYPVIEGGPMDDKVEKICTIKIEVESSRNDKAPHSTWRNYDDINEYFWSMRCFNGLKWPFGIIVQLLRHHALGEVSGEDGVRGAEVVLERVSKL
jgi:hypothetical protein